MFQVLALCQRETFLCHSLWQRANTQNVIFSNLNGDQFIYIINSYILFIINFSKLFFLIHDPIWSGPGFANTAVVSTFLSTLSQSYFCMNMHHIIAVRFRCWCFDLTVVHIDTLTRLCSAGSCLPKGTEFLLQATGKHCHFAEWVGWLCSFYSLFKLDAWLCSLVKIMAAAKWQKGRIFIIWRSRSSFDS